MTMRSTLLSSIAGLAVAGLHCGRLRHCEQQSPGLPEQIRLLPPGQPGQLLRPLTPRSNRPSPFAGRSMQRQRDQRGARQQHQQEQPESQAKENSAYGVNKLSHMEQ